MCQPMCRHTFQLVWFYASTVMMENQRKQYPWVKYITVFCRETPRDNKCTKWRLGKANTKTVLLDKTPGGVWGIIKVTLPRGLFKEMNKIRAKEFKRHTNIKYCDNKIKQKRKKKTIGALREKNIAFYEG